MKPPRYLLREYIILFLLRSRIPGRFLELGFGTGELLVTLAKRGFYGAGYDSSIRAFDSARSVLNHHGVTQVELLDKMPDSEKFDYIMFFELIGYVPDPLSFLVDLKRYQHEHSVIIFSFTNSKHQGIAEKNSGDMSCFDRGQVERLLADAGYDCVELRNYGYPLANLLRPLLNASYATEKQDDKSSAIASSGLHFQHSRFRLLGLLLNRFTIRPFAWLQLLFGSSDLGTGYVVLARPVEPNE